MAAFTALVYLNSTYESIILYFSDRLLQKLDLASRIVHDNIVQLHVVVLLTEGLVQIKLAGFNWVYSSQATAVGILLSAESKISKKVNHKYIIRK